MARRPAGPPGERASKQGLNGSLLEIPEMSSRLVKVYRSCGSTMVPVTGCISRSGGRELIILLAGGDKTTQAKDIKVALRLARNLSE